ncbi:hypothetical protein SAMN02982929_06730 [Saccharopolyspora kobensis]|uniref:Uncharacterized protein n=1 Tax=Saccharopolyspora kobensis TaxID=146035 RepID=A0A1H6EHU7_9PSEU|nr:hypothetical protein SAMN02982929_06730 [Saccharopolyspora kobensis]SFC79814.1 hypothetical protein SAMN05216506_1011723 [Saccharopolyspora kobensis]
MPATVCPRSASHRPTRPSPQPISTVRRPGSGVIRAKAGSWNSQKNESLLGVRVQSIQSAAFSSQDADTSLVEDMLTW